MRVGQSPAHRHSALQSSAKSLDQVYEGKVIAVHPEDSSVDVALYGGQILRHVKVLFNSANTVAGFRYLASVVNNADAQNTQKGIVDKAVPTKIADTYATIVYVHGQSLAPRVIGFVFPNDAQMHIDELGLALFRHESGVYTLIDKNGHHEVHYPDGSYIIASPESSPTPKQLTSSDQAQDWNVPTSQNPVNLVISLSQGITIIAKNGVLTLQAGSAVLTLDGNSGTITARGAHNSTTLAT
jgi:hypothetical protein